MKKQLLSYQQIALLSLPIILANVTLPLQGLIDIAIIGHLDSSIYLSAIGLATQFFSLLFVSFNFLQYASSGLSAQAIGENDIGKLKRVLLRALLFASLIGFTLIMLQPLLLKLGFWLFSVPENLTSLFDAYFSIRIWGAPFELANYAFVGWFAGQSQPKLLFRQQLFISTINILLNALFVVGFKWDIVGVAWGTLIANMFGTVCACMFSIKLLSSHHSSKLQSINWKKLFKYNEFIRVLRLNRDIWIRSTILILCFTWITRLSTQQGSVILAANIVLLQLITLSSFAMDGIAVTTESQVGQAFGKKDNILINFLVIKTTKAAFFIALLLSFIFFISRPLYLTVMTDIQTVSCIAGKYYYFAAFSPVVAVLAYQFDGIMFGLTANTIIRNSMIFVAIIFFPSSYYLTKNLGNSGVWLSLYCFFLLRGAILIRQYHRLIKKLSNQPNS